MLPLGTEQEDAQMISTQDNDTRMSSQQKDTLASSQSSSLISCPSITAPVSFVEHLKSGAVPSVALDSAAMRPAAVDASCLVSDMHSFGNTEHELGSCNSTSVVDNGNAGSMDNVVGLLQQVSVKNLALSAQMENVSEIEIGRDSSSSGAAATALTSVNSCFYCIFYSPSYFSSFLLFPFPSPHLHFPFIYLFIHLFTFSSLVILLLIV